MKPDEIKTSRVAIWNVMDLFNTTYQRNTVGGNAWWIKVESFHAVTPGVLYEHQVFLPTMFFFPSKPHGIMSLTGPLLKNMEFLTWDVRIYSRGKPWWNPVKCSTFIQTKNVVSFKKPHWERALKVPIWNVMGLFITRKTVRGNPR